MVHLDAVIILRIFFSLMFSLTVGLTGTIIISDSIKRLRIFHPIGVGLISMGIGGIFLIYRSLVYPSFWHEGITFSFLFYTTGFLFFHVHNDLLRNEKVNTIKLTFNGSLILTTFILQLLWMLDYPVALVISFYSALFILFAVGVPSLLPLIYGTIQDLSRLRIRNQVAELLGFGGLLLTITSSSIANILELQFDPIYVYLTLLAAAFSGASLFYAYTTDRTYLYRFPYKIYYLLGYHDSGMTLFQLEIVNPEFNLNHREVLLVNTTLRTIEVAVKQLLKAELRENVVKTDTVKFMLNRAPQKKITFGVISEKITWYLRRSMEMMLESFSMGILSEKDGEVPILDNLNIQAEVFRTLERVFPYLMITLKKTGVERNQNEHNTRM